ncbi:nitroreductase family deazaflavin-dependent oxidoreductase [Streptomyces sp. ET3-23]|uniref:nitroreductase/quinone reductase family protein n=1 Tax=Streptomyces sp. ET3-23 TaxID=2885643 RepID=UPI001D0FD6EF|nr:nitroreductase/quinone reductase family protein [Streptomyces sp. ET3-23]MCC2278494.1 nitroreductase family deazaflavin-dependent oxidoreductase [Streptomyces sp. ET3-23]
MPDDNTNPAHNSNPFNLRVIEEFRANGGRVGGQFAGVKLLLLTTRGTRSGLLRTTPLVHLPDGERLVVFASNGGAPTAPAWFRNAMAAPDDITVEVGEERYAARAGLVDAAEHDTLWARQIAADPAFAAFRERALQAGRVTPLVALRRHTTRTPRCQTAETSGTPGR